MKKEKIYNDTALLAGDLAGDENIRGGVQKKIAANEMVSSLIGVRHKSNLSQDMIAKRMNCHPSKISRIESGNDLNLKWGDIVDYCRAAEHTITVLFESDAESLPASARIKNSVLRIHKDLSELAEIAKSLGEDDEITKKINMFYGEVLLNFMVRYSENYESAGFTIPIAKSDRISSDGKVTQEQFIEA